MINVHIHAEWYKFQEDYAGRKHYYVKEIK